MKFRKWRLLLSLATLSACLAVFFGRGEDWRLIRRAVLATQFTTDITHVGGKLLPALVIMALTLWLGRWYCALLCPAGLLQDLASRAGRRLGWSRLRYARIPFAANVVFMLAAIIFSEVLFLDPIAMFDWLAAPAGALARDGVWGALRLYSRAAPAFIAMGAVFLLLLVLPLFFGRVFCDVVCPAGTLFRLVGLLPGRRVAIAADKCVSCGRCAGVCSARCADPARKRIEAERCFLCFDCAAVCRPGAIGYDRRDAGDRRGFLATAGAAVLGGGYVFSREIRQRLGFGHRDAAKVAPPGSGGQIGHAGRCVGCQACVLACPVGIIRADGVDSRPTLDFQTGYCQYNCLDCLSSCPAGVFSPLSLEEKQKTRLARVELDLRRCVVATRDEACGACAEVCPTHAVVMREQGEGRPTIPDFVPGHCIGCGACFHVCPSTPRAFSVIGLPRHEISDGVRNATGHAEPPVPAGEGADSAADVTDFPF